MKATLIALLAAASAQDTCTACKNGATALLTWLNTPEEVATVALFLCSSQGGWVTGQTIAVDGGQHLGWQTPDVLGVE